MTMQLARALYVSEKVETSPPGHLVVMLYDALLRDVTDAGCALARSDLETTNGRLIHAQEIVLELNASLRLDAWDGAPALKQIYEFLYDRLVAANVRKDATVVAECRQLIAPLRDAWAMIVDHGRA